MSAETARMKLLWQRGGGALKLRCATSPVMESTSVSVVKNVCGKVWGCAWTLMVSTPSASFLVESCSWKASSPRHLVSCGARSSACSRVSTDFFSPCTACSMAPSMARCSDASTVE